MEENRREIVAAEIDFTCRGIFTVEDFQDTTSSLGPRVNMFCCSAFHFVASNDGDEESDIELIIFCP